MEGRRCLVTGGAGFLGSHLCRRLAEAGAEVHATSRQARPDGEGGVRWWRVDDLHLEAARRLLDEARPDRLFHLSGSVTAAPDLALVPETFQSLLASTVNLLCAAAERDCGRFILSGSLTEPAPGHPDATPMSPYAAAKWASSAYGRMFHRLYGLPLVTVRAFMTYGPGQHPTKLVPYTTLSLLRGETPRVASGRWRADWVFVDDVIDGIMAAATAKGVEGRELDLGTGRLTSIREVVEMVKRLTGCDSPIEFDPGRDRPEEIVRAADIATTRAALGWAALTALPQGLERTVAWYRERAEVETSMGPGLS